MNLNKQNFELWFAQPLRQLFQNEHAGFPILMISLPILERYLRQKSGCHEAKLNSDAHQVFQQLFGLAREEEAKIFWQVYRNGLLHQATFSKAGWDSRIMPAGFLTADVPHLKFDHEAKIVYVNPNGFAAKVLHIVEGDFATFEGLNSPNHPLAVVAGDGRTITPELSACTWPTPS